MGGHSCCNAMVLEVLTCFLQPPARLTQIRLPSTTCSSSSRQLQQQQHPLQKESGRLLGQFGTPPFQQPTSLTQPIMPHAPACQFPSLEPCSFPSLLPPLGLE